MKPNFRLRSFILASSALFAVPSAFAQTTYNGTSGTAGTTDTWNIAGRWNSGIPTGAISAIIDPSKYVVVNAVTGTYSGSLSIGTGSTLQIGWTTVDATRYNALGNGNVTMAAGSSLVTRNEGTMNINTLTLTGESSISGGSSTQRGATMNFGAISGAYTLSIQNHQGNFTTGNTNLNAANSFSALILSASGDASSTVFAKVAGSLGTGDVTLNSGKLTFGTAAGALDIMANTGVLRINGGIASDRVTMTASDSIGGVTLNGAKQLSGTYTSSETWLGGGGALTVLGATSAYWDIDGTSSGAGGTAPAGIWGGTSNWSSAAAGNVATTTWTVGQNAIFAAGTGATGSYGVTVSGTQDVAGFGFEEGNVTLSGDTLNLTETAAVVVKTGASANIQSAISQNAPGFALHKSGAGALTLAGANTYTGGTLIAEGTLNINAAGVAGVSGPLGNGGTFTVNGGTIDNTSGSAKVVLNVNPISVGGDFAFSTGGGTANNNLTLPGAVNLGGGTRTITNNGAGVLTLGGGITNGTLAKSGSGTLRISGTNSHAGTTINAGKLVAVGSSALGSGTITMQTGSSTLHLQRDSSLTVANAWSFPTRNFTQTIIIDRVNSGNSADWTVSGGLAQLSGNTMIWQKGSNITNTPTVDLSGGMPSTDSTVGTIKMVAESVNLRINNISNTRARTMELAGDTTGNEVYGIITQNNSHPSGLLKSGTGTWTLSGATHSQSGAYSNGTTVTGGILNTTKATALSKYNTAGKVIINGGTLGVRVGGAGWTTTEVDTMLTNATKTSGAIGIDTTNGNLTQWTPFAGAGNFGALGLTKLGSNTLILDQANTYTGTTNVNAGTLSISSSGSIANTTAVTVAAGAKFIYNSSTALHLAPDLNGSGSNKATFSGEGAVNAAMTLNSLDDVLSPGNSPGTQTFTPAQDWASFSYDWEVNNFTGTTAGTDFDQIILGSTLNLSGGSGAYQLNVLGLTAGDVGGLVPNFSEINRSWTILTSAGTLAGFNAANWAINTGGFTDPDAGSWTLSQSGNNLVLNYTVVPEPPAALLGGFGLLMLLRRRR